MPAVTNPLPKRAYQGQPGVATAVLATVPAAKLWIIKEIILDNTDAAAQTVTLGISGTTAAKRITSAKSVPANDLVILATNTPLNAAETIDGLQSLATGITVTISVIEYDYA